MGQTVGFRILVGRLAGLVAVLLLAVGPGEVSAQAKGAVTLYTSESLDKVNEMKLDFEKRNPGITLNIYRSGTQVVISKLQAEFQAGGVLADMIWMADIDYFEDLAKKDLLVVYNPAEGEKVAARFKYEGGRYHEVRLIFNTVALNTLRVKTRPTSWRDLIDPKVKGKVGMASPFYSGAAFSTLGTQINMAGFGWEYYRKLKDNGVVIEQSNGTVAKKLATGEFHLVSVVDFMVREAKASGSPVDHIWPTEGAILVPTPFGILKGAKNPEGARAFLRYLYSPEGQRLFVQQGYVPVLPGIDGPKDMPAEKLEVILTDQAYIGKHREELKAKYRELFELK
ncbi:MAG TPA: ABC transporter substrate-binding protein [Candidatus Methylomirabilis sp.]|nr:ABC transporter substrate-binding protein [Candidatus Methylomirabilis sp.]HSC70574.1 ABC transporter substrate-binding protein [Candidatus Methylomirabilis sp.]